MIRRPPISTLLPYTTLFRCPASFKRLLGGALWLRRASLPEDPPSFRGPKFARSELNNLRRRPIEVAIPNPGRARAHIRDTRPTLTGGTIREGSEEIGRASCRERV